VCGATRGRRRRRGVAAFIFRDGDGDGWCDWRGAAATAGCQADRATGSAALPARSPPHGHTRPSTLALRFRISFPLAPRAALRQSTRTSRLSAISLAVFTGARGDRAGARRRRGARRSNPLPARRTLALRFLSRSCLPSVSPRRALSLRRVMVCRVCRSPRPCVRWSGCYRSSIRRKRD